MRWIKVAFWLAVLVTTIVLLVPGDMVLIAKVWVATWFPMAASLDAADVTEHADKLVHVGLFAILGIVGKHGWLRADQRRRVVVFLLGFGVFTEALQLLVPGRSASMGDWLADAIGVALGSGFVTSTVRRCLGMAVVTTGV
jgi:VanZ family protein